MSKSRIALVALVFASSLLLVAAASAPARAGGKCKHKGKVTICHRPPGNPGNAHTVSVASSAVKAHLAHGDAIGACAPACGSNGSTCGGDSACCSGFCDDGVCATPCAQNGGSCGAEAQCCSGFCDDGVCATPCAAEGAACGAGTACCSGNCQDGQCVAACGTDGNACETGADCCSGICTDTTKTCASQCTVGPELHGPPCDRDLDCCEGQGICIIDLCYPENFGCSAVGQACNPDEGVFCCFNDACFDGVCVQQ